MRNPLRILIVDDHPLVRNGAKRILELELPNATIDDVGDSIQAKRALSSHKYDLIILDLELPGEDGISLM